MIKAYMEYYDFDRLAFYKPGVRKLRDRKGEEIETDGKPDRIEIYAEHTLIVYKHWTGKTPKAESSVYHRMHRVFEDDNTLAFYGILSGDKKERMRAAIRIKRLNPKRIPFDR